MEMRTTKPEKGNKYYNTKSNGGYSGCIKGSPTDKDCNVLSNCVGWSNGRFAEIIGKDKIEYQLTCNAENFIERAKSYGLEISDVPTLGGIMVWRKGKAGNSSDGAGHVAIVERIDSSNQIYTSESGWGNKKAFWNSVRTNNNGRWGCGSSYTFRGCIVNPTIGNVTAPTKEVDPFPNVSDEELAKRVWANEFGSGETRKKKLGSRYASVQALVNKGIGKPSNTSITYTVKKGDTLSSIANKNKMSYKDLYAKNKSLIDSENKKRGVATSKMWVYPNQVLKIK